MVRLIKIGLIIGLILCACKSKPKPDLQFVSYSPIIDTKESYYYSENSTLYTYTISCLGYITNVGEAMAFKVKVQVKFNYFTKTYTNYIKSINLDVGEVSKFEVVGDKIEHKVSGYSYDPDYPQVSIQEIQAIYE